MSQKRALARAETKKKILDAASALFIKSGFEGVSISEIAKKADINQSLIYHYFSSKEELWKSVKASFVEEFAGTESMELDPAKGLRDVLKQIVLTRFQFYEDNPEVIRLMGWQKLENEKEKLAGGTQLSPSTWKEAFQELKKRKEIRKDIDIDMMVLFISSAIAGAFTEDFGELLKTPKSKKQYLEMLIECFLRAFA